MHSLILVLHVVVAIAIIALVLLQHGKGADAGAAFGSGASGTMFGSQGATPFLIRLTTVLAAVFFATSLSLSYISAHQQKPEDQLIEAVTGKDQSTNQQAPKANKQTQGTQGKQTKQQ